MRIRGGGWLKRENAGLVGPAFLMINQQCNCLNLQKVAGSTGLEPAASGVTGRRSNQLNYDPKGAISQLAND